VLLCPGVTASGRRHFRLRHPSAQGLELTCRSKGQLQSASNAKDFFFHYETTEFYCTAASRYRLYLWGAGYKPARYNSSGGQPLWNLCLPVLVALFAKVQRC